MKALTKDKAGRALDKQTVILAKALLDIALPPTHLGIGYGPQFMQTIAIEGLREAGLYHLVTQVRLKRGRQRHAGINKG